MDRLLEVVPEHARRILEHAHERRHDRLVALNDRLGPLIRRREELAQLDEAREAPVALVVVEAVMRLRLDEARRVARVGDGQRKLRTDVPALLGVLGIAVVEVDRDHVVRLPRRLLRRQTRPIRARRRTLPFGKSRMFHLCPPHSNSGDVSFLPDVR